MSRLVDFLRVMFFQSINFTHRNPIQRSNYKTVGSLQNVFRHLR